MTFQQGILIVKYVLNYESAAANRVFHALADASRRAVIEQLTRNGPSGGNKALATGWTRSGANSASPDGFATPDPTPHDTSKESRHAHRAQNQ